MSWRDDFDGSDSVYCKESVKEMEPLSSKLPLTNQKKTRDVDEFHWETGQRTSEDMTTQNREKRMLTMHLLMLKYKEMC